MKDLESRTHYELLGLEPGASTEEIKEAYREIARIYHPDSNFYDDIIDDTGPGDSDVFKAITAAYQVLVNEQKRKVYDESLPKGLESWGEDDGTSTPSPFVAAEADERPQNQEEIPEEWRKEREYFEEHFEEILRPAPKINLTSSMAGESVDENSGPAADSISEWEERSAVATEPRFGRVATDKELSFLQGVGAARRGFAGPSLDPVDLLLYFGLPVMFVIVMVELWLFYS